MDGETHSYLLKSYLDSLDLNTENTRGQWYAIDASMRGSYSGVPNK